MSQVHYTTKRRKFKHISEKQNYLVRRFFPKGKSFVSVSDEAVALVED